MKLQSWINPRLNLKPRYYGYRPNSETGVLERVEYKYPKFDLRLKFTNSELASQWVFAFRNTLAELSGTGDYVTIMQNDKPYHLTFVGNMNRTTGELLSTVTFTFIEALRVINEEPALAEVTAEEFPIN